MKSIYTVFTAALFRAGQRLGDPDALPWVKS